MTVIIEITSPSDQTDALVGALKEHEGVISIKLQPGASLRPPGDVVTIVLLDREQDRILTSLHRRFGFGETR